MANKEKLNKEVLSHEHGTGEKCVSCLKENSQQSWKIELEKILDDNFPKLNQDNPEISSSNNRSAALVMFAYTEMLIEKLLSQEISKIKEEEKEKYRMERKFDAEIIRKTKEELLKSLEEKIEATKDNNSAFMCIKNEKDEIEDWTLPVSEIKVIIEELKNK